MELQSFVEDVLAREIEPGLSGYDAQAAHRRLGIKLKGMLPKGVSQYEFVSRYFGRPISSFKQITWSEAQRLWRELGKYPVEDDRYQ